jgi:hypothetical protein
LIQLGVCGAALGLLTALVIFYGWRYGFTPLPDPVPGVRLGAMSQVEWPADSTNNAWYWACEANRGAPTGEQVRPVMALCTTWTVFGLAALTNREALAQHFVDRAQLEKCLEAALRCGSSEEPPGDWRATERAAPESPYWPPRLFHAAGRLWFYPLWLAAEAEAKGDTRSAFIHLAAARQLEARLYSGLRSPSPYAGRLAAAWRRLALAGPPVTPAEARALLEIRVMPTNALSTLEATLRQEGARLEAKLVANGEKEREVGLWNGLSRRAARPADFERLVRAYCGQVLSRLEAGRWEDALATATALRRRWKERGWLQRSVDRPAVWAALTEASSPEAGLVGWKQQAVLSQSCRLALALRCYREAHQVWPERLEQLVPEFLTAVPADPFTGEPFGYHRGTNWWVLWSVGLTRLKPPLDAPRATLSPPGASGIRSVFYSTEAEKAQAWWEQMQPAQRAEMLQGLGGASSEIIGPRGLRHHGVLPSLNHLTSRGLGITISAVRARRLDEPMEPETESDETGGFPFAFALLALLAVGLCAMILVRSSVRINRHPASSSCVNNLRQLEGATEQWALENKKTAGTLVDSQAVLPYLKGSAMPVCPEGGVYRLGQVGAPPQCSVRGHTL